MNKLQFIAALIAFCAVGIVYALYDALGFVLTALCIGFAAIMHNAEDHSGRLN